MTTTEKPRVRRRFREHPLVGAEFDMFGGGYRKPEFRLRAPHTFVCSAALEDPDRFPLLPQDTQAYGEKVVVVREIRAETKGLRLLSGTVTRTCFVAGLCGVIEPQSPLWHDEGIRPDSSYTIVRLSSATMVVPKSHLRIDP